MSTRRLVCICITFLDDDGVPIDTIEVRPGKGLRWTPRKIKKRALRSCLVAGVKRYNVFEVRQ